ncbi:MAG: hypothetical protein OXH50_05860, partial [Gemmatimonadetes bacterium]|nr:hypothetical protein [Gemmatimonadota bacterium]
GGFSMSIKWKVVPGVCNSCSREGDIGWGTASALLEGSHGTDEVLPGFLARSPAFRDPCRDLPGE